MLLKITSFFLKKKPNIILISRKISSSVSAKHKNRKSNIKTAGIIVIGDEILKGNVLDTNSHHAMKTFYSLGIQVDKVSIIGDTVDVIASEVKSFSKKYNYVLTTGGIGPTHDDVTFEGIAKAFYVNLHPDPVLVKICSKFYKTDDLKAPGMKIAFIPETAKLTFAKDSAGQNTNYPNVSIKNVYIFPGIPQLFKKSFDLLAKELFESSTKFFTNSIYLNITEQLVVRALDKVVAKYPMVTFGSYPDMNNKTYKVKLTIESTDEATVKKATLELLENFSKSNIVKIDAT